MPEYAPYNKMPMLGNSSIKSSSEHAENISVKKREDGIELNVYIKQESEAQTLPRISMTTNFSE
jgi:hypothetical protein